MAQRASAGSSTVSWADDFLAPQTAPPAPTPPTDWNSYLEGVGPNPTPPPPSVYVAPPYGGIPAMLESYAKTGLYQSGLGALGLVPQGWALPQASALPQGPLEAHLAQGAYNLGESAPWTAGAAALAGASALTGGLPLLGAVGPGFAAAVPVSNVVSGQLALGGRELGLSPAEAGAIGSLGGFAAGGALSYPNAAATAGADLLEKAGLGPTSAAYVSQSPLMRWLTRPYAPDLAGPLGSAIESEAAKLGPSRTYEEAAARLVPAVKDWRQNGMTAEIQAAEAPLVAAVPPGAPLAHDELAARIDQALGSNITEDRQAAQEVLRYLRGGGPQMKTIADDIENWSKTGVGAPPTSTFEEGRAVRTNVGNLLKDNRFANLQGPLRYLYGGTVEDLGNVAAAHGALDEFANFNRVSTEAHNFNEGPVEAILGASQPERAVRQILANAKVGPSEIRALDTRFPQEVRNIAAAELRHVGLQDPLDAGSPVSPGFARAVDAYNRAGSLPPEAGAVRAVGEIQQSLRPGGALAAKRPGPSLVAGESGLGALTGGIYGLMAGQKDPVFDLLMGGAGGSALSVAPYLFGRARASLAESPLAAASAARSWHPLGLGASSIWGTMPPPLPENQR